MIVKKRTDFEYALKRRAPKKADFLRYIEYELNVEALRKKRRDRLYPRHHGGKKGGKTTMTQVKWTHSDHAGVRRIHHLFDRFTRKFHGELEVWLEYIRFATESKSYRAVGRIFARAIQLHPRRSEIWMLAANWEWEENGSVTAARTLLQRALRLNADARPLWLHYFTLELMFLVKIMERQSILGIAREDDAHASASASSSDNEQDQESDEEQEMDRRSVDEDDSSNVHKETSIQDTMQVEKDAQEDGSVVRHLRLILSDFPMTLS